MGAVGENHVGRVLGEITSEAEHGAREPAESVPWRRDENGIHVDRTTRPSARDQRHEAALDAGAAFVYRLQGAQWVLSQKLMASDADDEVMAAAKGAL